MSFPLNHDLHVHSMLSLCSRDPEQCAANVIRYAAENDYSAICLTDHYWQDDVPGPSDWYAKQNFAHVSQSLPLPDGGKTRVMFGCETDFCGAQKLGVTKGGCDKFDFVVIPPNHFHMENFTRDESINTAPQIARLLNERLIDLTKLDLPWHKIGIAHLTCSLTFSKGDYTKVFPLLDEGELRRAFSFFAEHGTGIELNDSCFRTEWTVSEEGLRVYAIAKEEGCRFYRASDAHHPKELPIHDGVRLAAERLGLTEDDLYTVPEK